MRSTNPSHITRLRDLYPRRFENQVIRTPFDVCVHHARVGESVRSGVSSKAARRDFVSSGLSRRNSPLRRVGVYLSNGLPAERDLRERAATPPNDGSNRCAATPR